MEFASGQRFGERFVLEAPAEHCGLGLVWKARDTETGDICLVKRVRPDCDLRELDLLRKLQGTRVVSVRATGGDATTLWVATDLPVGESLARNIERTRGEKRERTLPEARTIALGLCAAVATAHRIHEPALTVHGGLTPASVYVRALPGDERHVSVGDFGLLRHLVDASWSAPSVSGELWFPVAPELGANNKRATPATDVFAIALTVVETLAHAPARNALWMTLERDARALASAVERARPGLHPSVRDALAAALHPDPSKRPKDAEKLARMLRDATWSESPPVVPARPERREERAPAPPSEPPAPARARIVEVRSLPSPGYEHTTAEARPTPPAPERRPPRRTVELESGFGDAAGPSRRVEETIKAGTPSAPPAVSHAVFFAEPDTEIDPSPRVDRDAQSAEATVPLANANVRPTSGAHDVTVALDAEHVTFGKSHAPSPEDSGTMLAAPNVAAHFQAAAAQRTPSPTTHTETQALASTELDRMRAASRASTPRRGEATERAVVERAASRTWIPWAVMVAAVVIAGLVFYGLVRS